jgi:hypothetical protein
MKNTVALAFTLASITAHASVPPQSERERIRNNTFGALRMDVWEKTSIALPDRKRL